MKKRLLLGSIFVIAFSIQMLLSAASTSKADIEELFLQWNASLHTCDPKAVTENYAEDAILIPTLSNNVRHNHAEIEDYFEHFLLKKPVGKIDEDNIRIYGDIAINSGLYTFDIVNDQGKHEKVLARFTFVYHKVDGKWLIVEHHSSMLPEKINAIKEMNLDF